MDTLTDIRNAYEAWIVEHPEAVGDIQNTAKWLSFFLSGRVSTARKLYKVIEHLIKNYNKQIIRRPDDSKENVVQTPTDMVNQSTYPYTWENIKKDYKTWLVEHPKAPILIILVASVLTDPSTSVLISQVITRLILDYNDGIIKRSRDAKALKRPLPSKL